MFFLDVRETFSAAHALRNYPGPCASLHGHNWSVRIRLSAERTDRNAMTADYAILKQWIGEVLQQVDHRSFNELPDFQQINPTSEAIAEFFFRRLERATPPNVTLVEVEIAETDKFSVTYRPDR